MAKGEKEERTSEGERSRASMFEEKYKKKGRSKGITRSGGICFSRREPGKDKSWQINKKKKEKGAREIGRARTRT